jgi:hypothetical protein
MFVADRIVYRARVLDAWVEAHANAARDGFTALQTVKARQAAVAIDGAAHAELRPPLLRQVFSARRSYILIHGEGGAGKTTLARQLGLWALADDPDSRLCRYRMLPVLVEEDLVEPQPDAVRGMFQVQLALQTPIPDTLVHALLRSGRVLVIIDSLSERDEFTRAAIRPTSSAFLASRLVVTSRRDETLGNAPVVRLLPMRIAGNHFSNFVGAYLTMRRQRDAFDDPGFFELCGDLSRLAAGRDVTPLLATLYIDLMVARKEARASGSGPTNVPELMLAYVANVNRRRKPTDPDDAIVQHDAKSLAWACLRRTLRPGYVSTTEALAQLQGDDRKQRLQHLRENLRLVENVEPNAEKLRFSLDPVAEYLAALQVVETTGEIAAESAGAHLPENARQLTRFVSSASVTAPT